MPDFQRRHYELIARALRDDRPTDLFSATEYARVVDRLIQLFERDNLNFDRRRFESAVYRDGSQ